MTLFGSLPVNADHPFKLLSLYFMHKLFITGTDTDAGKTFVATTLLFKAQALGLSAFGLKPIAAGCHWSTEHSSAGEWHNDDALLLQAASSIKKSYSIHNPIAFPQAIAPHIAAELNRTPLTLTGLLERCQPGLDQYADVHLIEGAGGWLVPINKENTLADFAQQLNHDIILVVGMKLGCINHALLTQQLLLASDLNFVGWVANHIDADMSEQDANFDYLKQHIQAPCLGRIPFSPKTHPQELIEHINLPA
jgi:dethiobiotin synthetase